MAAVTKGSGKYFWENERVWREAREAGVAPFYVGQWRGTYRLPDSPTPQAFRDLAEGHKVLKRVQKNRVGCFDLTFTFDKSVSVLCYGLVPPDRQKQRTEALIAAARPALEQLLRDRLKMASGPQGKTRTTAEGFAVGFAHRQSWMGAPHAHIHFAVPNVVVAADGTAKSIANAREALYEQQAELRARVQKQLDENLQRGRFITTRDGNMVALANIPKEMLAELSPARAAMDEARAAKGFSSARAQDFYARQVRRDAGERVEKSPAEMHRECTAVAKKHGVTIESLRLPAGQEPQILDPLTAKFVAFGVGMEAVDQCAKRYGRFTETQFRERMYTLSIGEPTTLKYLDREITRLLTNPKAADIRQVRTKDGQVLYTTDRAERTTRKAEQQFERATPRADAKAGVGDAWGEFVAAAKGLGSATLVATAQAATRVVKRVTEAVNPAPQIREIDATRLPQLVASLTPTPYFKAHAKAILRGLLNLGNPHQMAGRAEDEFARLRAHNRLDKNTVIVVRRGSLASARDLHALAKIARRDGCSVVLAERPKQLRRADRGQAKQKRHGKHSGRDRSSEN